VAVPDLEQQLILLARRLQKPVRLPGPGGFTQLDRPAYHALWRIVEDGPLRPTALAGMLEVDLSVVSRQVRALEDAAFVVRTTDPVDARAALVSATEDGIAAFRETQRLRTQVLDDVLGEWSEQERATFVRLLTLFNAKLEASIAQRQAES